MNYIIKVVSWSFHNVYPSLITKGGPVTVSDQMPSPQMCNFVPRPLWSQLLFQHSESLRALSEVVKILKKKLLTQVLSFRPTEFGCWDVELSKGRLPKDCWGFQNLLNSTQPNLTPTNVAQWSIAHRCVACKYNSPPSQIWQRPFLQFFHVLLHDSTSDIVSLSSDLEYVQCNNNRWSKVKYTKLIFDNHLYSVCLPVSNFHSQRSHLFVFFTKQMRKRYNTFILPGENYKWSDTVSIKIWHKFLWEWLWLKSWSDHRYIGDEFLPPPPEDHR